jgi:hypothetical protein
VAAYLTDLSPKRLLERKLHESAARAKARLEAREDPEATDQD